MTAVDRSVDVVLERESYPILVEAGLLGRAGAILASRCRSGRLVTIADPTAWDEHGKRFSAGLAEAGIDCAPILVAGGEDSKSWAGLAGLIDRLLELGVERGETIAAFGGGVIGDLTGFAAAILKRGCAYVQIPTTLLAQVDSSVGGKTAINVPGGKNLVGLFHQPSIVLIDPDCLDSLPQRQLRAGYAEVVKYGLISDLDFFSWCEANADAILTASEARSFAITRCVKAKAAIVGRDEQDRRGERALLNLGHTFGHALEAASGFSDRLLHGEAVSIGMTLAFRFSAEAGLCEVGDSDRVARHLASAGLPTELAELGLEISGSELLELMRQDKKASSGTLPFILARGIGRAFVDHGVDLADLVYFLDRQLERQHDFQPVIGAER